MTGQQVAAICALTLLFALAGLVAWLAAGAASKRERERFSREMIYREWEKRNALMARRAENGKRIKDEKQPTKKENHNGQRTC